jgi:glycosyltransferase involved in cell wall biosynthesis
MPADKVKVVPEGVDVNTFYPEDPKTVLDYVDGRFKFVVFGRWDYRKSTKEIIETFLKEFKPNEPVDLIISIDNPFSGDGHKTTEDRLQAYSFTDERIKVKHFPSREDYITYMKNGHVFLSCARSEGWNLPLIEAMACGTPSIYSACSGQMEFAEGKGLPVKVLGERPALETNPL